MLLLIDNYDSFTHNLARYFAELGQQVNVVRNDQLSLGDITGLAPDYMVFSPGPCTPDKAGITLSAIERFAGQIPIMGVCLGYQAIGQVFGANVIRAKQVMHGKTSPVHHCGSALFAGVSNPFIATRYHSLVLEQNTIADDFIISAWTGEAEQPEAIMAIEHKTLSLCGVQFHPESVLTLAGHQILGNFLNK